jgi:hypothetical protein
VTISCFRKTFVDRTAHGLSKSLYLAAMYSTSRLFCRDAVAWRNCIGLVRSKSTTFRGRPEVGIDDCVGGGHRIHKEPIDRCALEECFTSIQLKRQQGVSDTYTSNECRRSSHSPHGRSNHSSDNAVVEARYQSAEAKCHLFC